MRLPNAERAVVDTAKLRDYILNPYHPRGRHKARIFASKLGFGSGDTETVRAMLLRAALDYDAVVGEQDLYGRRYVVEFTMGGPAGLATVRSLWIVRRGENFPRLTSCYVL